MDVVQDSEKISRTRVLNLLHGYPGTMESQVWKPWWEKHKLKGFSTACLTVSTHIPSSYCSLVWPFGYIAFWAKFSVLEWGPLPPSLQSMEESACDSQGCRDLYSNARSGLRVRGGESSSLGGSGSCRNLPSLVVVHSDALPWSRSGMWPGYIPDLGALWPHSKAQLEHRVWICLELQSCWQSPASFLINELLVSLHACGFAHEGLSWAHPAAFTGSVLGLRGGTSQGKSISPKGQHEQTWANKLRREETNEDDGGRWNVLMKVC